MKTTSTYISNWIKKYAEENKKKSLIIGISGGIDSAVTSTLCANTNIETIVVSMPINQNKTQIDRTQKHISWLKKKYQNITSLEVDLSHVFNEFKNAFDRQFQNDLGLANTQARLRMTTLYQIASSKNGLVIGTGNKIEDFCIGFFTKYGDGGVDLSPIGDLMKSEVFLLAKYLDIIQDIQKAIPTDGLWIDNRSDEDQIGASYKEIENAINNIKSKQKKLNAREKEVITIYSKASAINKHKMCAIPVCLIPQKIK